MCESLDYVTLRHVRVAPRSKPVFPHDGQDCDGRLASATHALAPALLLLYTAPMGAVLACFSAYHLFLISVNQTSYEYAFKKAYTARANPHDRGCLGNWVGFCGGAPSVAAGEAPDVAHILI